MPRAIRALLARITALTTVLVLVLLTFLTAMAPGATAADTSTPAVGKINPPALWLQLNETPTETQLQFAAQNYRVAVFNAWQVPAMKRLKQLNPAIKVLLYKCLSSSRSYSGAYANGVDAAILPTGVGYGEASLRPEWFAKDVNGQRIQWNGYGGHWQMATWDPAYQQRWADNVTREVTANGWDGVMADNALPSLRYYTSQTLSDGRTDAQLRDSIDALVAKAGASLNAAGKIIVPNIGDGRLYDGRWNRLAAYGGGLEEQFLHWGTDPNAGYFQDWATAGWSTVVAEMSTPGLTLARTSAGPNDTRPYRYGLASFWIGGGGKGAFTAVLPDQYGGTPLRTEQTWDLGAPVTGMVKVGTAYTRTFRSGFVAANPSATQSQVVVVPSDMVDADGRRGGSVTLGPLSGVIYRSTATSVAEPTPAPTSVVSPTPSPATAPGELLPLQDRHFASGTGTWRAASGAAVAWAAQPQALAVTAKASRAAAYANGRVPVKAGQRLTLSAKARIVAGTTGRTGRIYVDFFNAAGAYIGSSTAGTGRALTGTMVTITNIVTVPTNATRASVVADVYGAAVGDTMHVDDVSAY